MGVTGNAPCGAGTRLWVGCPLKNPFHFTFSTGLSSYQEFTFRREETGMNLASLLKRSAVSTYAALMLVLLLTLMLVLSACGETATPATTTNAATTAATTTSAAPATTAASATTAAATTATTTTAAAATTTTVATTAAATTTAATTSAATTVSATTAATTTTLAATTGAATTAAGTTTGGTGTLVIGTVFTSKNLDPGTEYTETAFMVFHSTYQTLVTYKGNDVTKIVPDLAASWTISSDGKTYTFKLNPGFKFASGNPVTADDVVFSYKRLQNLKGQPAFVTANMTDFTAPDPGTVVITLKDVAPDTLSLLTTPSFGVLDSKTAQANGATAAADADKTDKAMAYLNAQSIGSGPYVITSYKPDSEIDLAKNPNYNGPVSYAKVIIKNQSDVNVQQASLEKGDIDFALDIGADQAKALNGKSGVTVTQTTSLTIFFILMNVDATISPSTAKPQVRQAIR